jgi:hypothetical protein
VSDRRQIDLRRFRFPSQYTGRVICTALEVPMCSTVDKFSTDTLPSIDTGGFYYHHQTQCKMVQFISLIKLMTIRVDQFSHQLGLK